MSFWAPVELSYYQLFKDLEITLSFLYSKEPEKFASFQSQKEHIQKLTGLPRLFRIDYLLCYYLSLHDIQHEFKQKYEETLSLFLTGLSKIIKQSPQNQVTNDIWTHLTISCGLKSHQNLIKSEVQIIAQKLTQRDPETIQRLSTVKKQENCDQLKRYQDLCATLGQKFLKMRVGVNLQELDRLVDRLSTQPLGENLYSIFEKFLILHSCYLLLTHHDSKNSNEDFEDSLVEVIQEILAEVSFDSVQRIHKILEAEEIFRKRWPWYRGSVVKINSS